MNYLKLINQFWRHNEIHCFGTSEISLYLHLLDVANTKTWQNPFEHSNIAISATIGISEKTIKKAKDNLVKAGLLKYKEGKFRRNYTSYFIVEIVKVVKIPAVASTLSTTLSTDVITGVPPADTPDKRNKLINFKTFAPPDIEDVKAYFIENGYSTDSAVRAFKFYAANDWRDSNEKQVKSWKQKMQGVWFKPENEAKATAEKQQPEPVTMKDYDQLFGGIKA